MRLPIFVWSVLATAVLMLLAAPMLLAALMMGALDGSAFATTGGLLLNPKRGPILNP